MNVPTKIIPSLTHIAGSSFAALRTADIRMSEPEKIDEPQAQRNPELKPHIGAFPNGTPSPLEHPVPAAARRRRTAMTAVRDLHGADPDVLIWDLATTNPTNTTGDPMTDISTDHGTVLPPGSSALVVSAEGVLLLPADNPSRHAGARLTQLLVAVLIRSEDEDWSRGNARYPRGSVSELTTEPGRLKHAPQGNCRNGNHGENRPDRHYRARCRQIVGGE